MTAIIELRGKEYELPTPLKVKEALQQLGLPAESYHLLRSGYLLEEEELLQEGDRGKLIPVISGG